MTIDDFLSFMLGVAVGSTLMGFVGFFAIYRLEKKIKELSK